MHPIISLIPSNHAKTYTAVQLQAAIKPKLTNTSRDAPAASRSSQTCNADDLPCCGCLWLQLDFSLGPPWPESVQYAWARGA